MQESDLPIQHANVTCKLLKSSVEPSLEKCILLGGNEMELRVKTRVGVKGTYKIYGSLTIYHKQRPY